MMKLSLLVIGMLCLSIVVCAGEVITNDTGEDATGLRVTFSEPVVITAFGDVLTSVDPLMMAYEFEFSGGVVKPGGSHWMNWAPLTGQVLSYEWMLQASKLADPNHSTEEEPDEGIALGSETQLGSETDAGYITWTGELVETKPKTITVVVYDESYIHDRFVGGENQPTVTFLVFHDEPSGWGRAIQDNSIETFTGPGGYVEKAYLPLQKEGERWVAEVRVILFESICAMEAWKDASTSREGFFGVNVVGMNYTLNATPLSEQAMQEAVLLHSTAWDEMVRRSVTDPYYKYGLYAARSLAVTHPEIYLQADALFLDHIESNSGFAAAFAEKNPHSASYFARTFFSGPPFSLDQVDLAEYQTMANADRFPSDVPVCGFLDQRLLSLASCLKDKDERITGLEKASILYFKLRGQSREQPFIVYCADERAYVASQGRMLSADGNGVENMLNSDAVLIFNEDFVWYPLMDRDDTDQNTALRDLVAKYGVEGARPSLSAQELRLVQTLRTSTSLRSPREWDLAKLAAVKGSPWVQPFRRICDRHLSGYPSDVWIFAIQQHWVHRANSVSPWTSWLAAYVLDSPTTDQGVQAMTNVWQRQLGMVHGHVWQCSLLRYTIDESVSIGAVHCVLHANCLASVLDLAGVENIIIQGSPATPGKINKTHTYIALPELGIVLSNGEITERGTVMDGSYSALFYVSKGPNWAFPFIDFYIGTWSPSSVAQAFESIRAKYGDQFHGFRGGSGSDKFRKTLVAPEEYLADLSSEQERWRPFSHP